ncbi:hypothetical protein Tco_1489855, partial [Tanacetum coccineum]
LEERVDAITSEKDGRIGEVMLDIVLDIQVIYAFHANLLEIVGFQVPSDDNNDDCSTFEEFQEKIMSGKKGKGTLKGNTFLQLKEGVCFIGDIHRHTICK